MIDFQIKGRAIKAHLIKDSDGGVVLEFRKQNGDIIYTPDGKFPTGGRIIKLRTDGYYERLKNVNSLETGLGVDFLGKIVIRSI